MTKRSRLIKALDNRFYVKFMQLEIGLLGQNKNFLNLHLGSRDMTIFGERALKKSQNWTKIPITFETVVQIQ